ncbi:unnamed protein product [Peronospora belbahrii]|uniref:Uncharacterized protein n=1 Tax=Peronospora belbahrii TaxID=622444 RepID=A0AAU9KQ76_9STRA|nr:unnamed protein product [Peronospora belbahrii]CAH0516202.1 unnamed protein product [Peronospora belbahrii]
MEKTLEAFKTSITPARAIVLFTQRKNPNRICPEHSMYLTAILEVCKNNGNYLVLGNIVQYAASKEMQTILLAKENHTRTDYLVQGEQFAHFAKAYKLHNGRKTLRRKRAFKSIVRFVSDRQRKEMRRCHSCHEVGHSGACL